MFVGVSTCVVNNLIFCGIVGNITNIVCFIFVILLTFFYIIKVIESVDLQYNNSGNMTTSFVIIIDARIVTDVGIYIYYIPIVCTS